MATQILMPALSPTMTEGKLARWLKNVGDEVRAGDVIAEIETDKATMEVEAVDEGKLAQILVDEGTEGVAVNTPIAVLAANGEDASAAEARPGAASAPKPAACRRSPAQASDRAGDRRAGRAAPAQGRAGGGARAGKGLGPDASRSPCARRCATRWRWRCARDDDVFLIGEEVAQYQGAYKISQGLLDEFGAAAGHRHADHRARLHRHGGRRGAERAAADRRVHDLQLRHAGDGPDHQLGGQDAVHVGRPDGLPDRVPRPQRRGGARRARSTRNAMRAGTRMCRG